MPFIKKMPAIEHFEVVLMFKTVKTPPTVKSPLPTLDLTAQSSTSTLHTALHGPLTRFSVTHKI